MLKSIDSDGEMGYKKTALNSDSQSIIRRERKMDNNTLLSFLSVFTVKMNAHKRKAMLTVIMVDMLAKLNSITIVKYIKLKFNNTIGFSGINLG